MHTNAIVNELAGGPYHVLDKVEKSTFATRVANLLQRVEYRRADTVGEKHAIFRMRYEGYSREGFIEPNASGIFTDADDECPNAWLIGVYIDGALASSIRLHVASRLDQVLPVTRSFPDVLEPKLSIGDVIIDATRQVSRLEFTRAYPFLPYVTMRSAFLAEEYFGADFITATCRAEYQLAFKRMYNAVRWSTPRPFPPLTRPHALMAYDCKAQAEATRARYPFVRSSPPEQRALFGLSSNGYDLLAEFSADRLANRLAERRADKMQQSTTCAA
jgi:hypothetical protein